MNDCTNELVGQAPPAHEPETLGQLLTPVSLGEDRFRLPNLSTGWARLFGGQVAAQALAAASATVGEDRLVNSLHAYFLRPGMLSTPIDCTVERERDGTSFSNRRVHAVQGGKPILTMIASWHTGEEGPRRDDLAMPGVGAPEDYPTSQEIAEENGAIEEGRTPFEIIEVRPVVGARMSTASGNLPGRTIMWMRFRDTHDADPAMARQMIAYASDLFLIGTALQPHREEMGERPVVASIDHAVRFHADPDISDWMLCEQTSDWAGAGRTLIRSRLFRRDGVRIASVSQEGLLRL